MPFRFFLYSGAQVQCPAACGSVPGYDIISVSEHRKTEGFEVALMQNYF